MEMGIRNDSWGAREDGRYNQVKFFLSLGYFYLPFGLELFAHLYFGTCDSFLLA